MSRVVNHVHDPERAGSQASVESAGRDRGRAEAEAH